MRKYERESERIFDSFQDARQALADRIRTEVVLPACRKYKVTFMAGNGGFSFYKHPYNNMYDVISDERDCRQHRKSGLIRALRILNMKCGEKFEIGHFVHDVTKEDIE